MNWTMYCIAFILWMTIVYLNLYFAMSKNRSFTFWLVLSLISGPIASFILMFITRDRVDYEKNGDIYKQIKYIQKKMRFKRFNWENYSSMIKKLDKNFDEKDLLELKYFLKTEVEIRKKTLTFISIISSIIVTFVVGFTVYTFTAFDSLNSNPDSGIIYYPNKYMSIYYIIAMILICLFILVWVTVFTLSSKIKLLNTLNYVHELKK